ncbi:MAG: exodeoxyribonuclease III [Desulfotomaculaceae bacterium]|nr:exodeoxyribonuclease III [Desulfotomaculaceae bacterium]MDD4766314.1 exodeoxyribonuclease III [Desulfotomaculaceae bacterium]
MFKVASFNTNSIRARLPLVLDWLDREKVDVLCLQETKVEDKDFPLADFTKKGYNAVFNGRKSYNGVAIISPHVLEKVHTGIGDWAEADEARLIEATVKGIPVVNTYVPQGSDPNSDKFVYKLKWIRSLREYFDNRFKPDDCLIWMGDFNVAPEPIDVHNPKKLYGRIGFHPEEHKALQYVKEWGFVDVFRLHVKEGGHYTFWDYRRPNLFERNLGWRVDHIWATGPMAARSRRAWIDTKPRGEIKPSDHTFIGAEFAW